PTDMQPQFTALMCMAFGESGMTENVFEHRYHYVNELRKMGGDIEVDGRYAKVNGRGFLHGATVKATDLRAGAALIVAGLAAVETTTVTDIVYIKRGYQDIVNKFRDLGADIEEVWDFNS
ncbi:MAG: UDP-N-acetylglucosamine 1-carboxyvinyltransferase, partial [Clostridia bacterium]|nr:UDP-N-acetylglucosamine 1-carboxyvinyltransferase [Clostridia bacterium]